MDASPLAVSTVYNVFVGIGCNLLAHLVVANHGSFTPGGFVSICAVMCLDVIPETRTMPPSHRAAAWPGSPSYGVQMRDWTSRINTGYGAAFIVNDMTIGSATMESRWFSNKMASTAEIA
ncbi:hypothetical protein EJB05_39953, partial [Eragrostis curvula]